MAYSITASEDSCYLGTTVLSNKLGLKSQEALDQAEKVAVTLRSVEVEQSPPPQPFTFDFYCGLHRTLFQDLYDWAGTLRTVNLSKKGTSFAPAVTLAQSGEAKFQRLQSMSEFRTLPRQQFVREVAEFYHDLNLLHPFREGNGRTQRLFFTLLIRRAGYDIRFADCDMDEFMIATIHAAHGVMDYLYDFFDTEIKP
ncbi:MAG: Fic family protein [Clostridiales bacterium]|nr:Fic family protein [Clostridiales bacterium]